MFPMKVSSQSRKPEFRVFSMVQICITVDLPVDVLNRFQQNKVL